MRFWKNRSKKRIKINKDIIHSERLESIGALSAGIAHDFNNILHAITGYVDICLMDTDENHPFFKDLNLIKTAAKRGSKLTTQLLTFSGRVESNLEPIFLNDIIYSVTEMLAHTISKSIKINVDLDETLMLINGDLIQIEQIIMNLCLNSRDAMDNKRGILAVKTSNVNITEEEINNDFKIKPGKYCILSVVDTGCGMSNETQKHIFEPFYTTKKEGNGLGLSIVYGIVKNHQGYISCESSIGNGTQFDVYFPAGEKKQPVKKTESKTEIIKKGTSSILIVDDEQDIRNFGARVFAKYGYKVYTAENGRVALKMYKHLKPDLVILDLIMPEMDGTQCLSKLMEMDSNAKVLISSGYSVDGYVRKSMEMGAKGFMAKPYSIPNLIAKVEEYLKMP